MNRASAKAHALHLQVGQLLRSTFQDDESGIQVVCDSACGIGQQHIPLAIRGPAAKEDVYCNVDILVLKGQRIRAVIEVDETGYSPTKICGKFLTSALCRCMTHRKFGAKPLHVGEHVVFIQVVKLASQSARSRKAAQWKNIEQSIQDVLPLRGSAFTKYRLFWGRATDFHASADVGQALLACLRSALQG